jgi:2-methylcitrate dehydratase
MAAFANGCMIRHTDFNVGFHNTEMLGGILAVGEALHSSGAQVMAGLVIAYEVVAALANCWGGNQDNVSGWDSPYHCVATAMACGNLMGLNQDELANAVSLALVPHVPLYSHVGTASMWKGSHSSESVKNGTWAALLAKEGFTGWCTPFEGRDGLIAHLGPFIRDLKLPTSPDGRVAIDTMLGGVRGYKFTASEGNTIAFHETIAPSVMEWTKADEIASMDFVTGSMYQWQEVCDPPKWDPRNRETADHSMPYNIARHLLDGYIYLDSFTKEKYMDPVARELMNKITCRPGVPDKPGYYLTVRKKSGEQKVFNSGPGSPKTRADLIAKYDRLVEFTGVNKDQAARARDQWLNLRAVKDIGEAIQTVAKFGNPKALTDRSPSRIA